MCSAHHSSSDDKGSHTGAAAYEGWCSLTFVSLFGFSCEFESLFFLDTFQFSHNASTLLPEEATLTFAAWNSVAQVHSVRLKPHLVPPVSVSRFPDLLSTCSS